MAIEGRINSQLALRRLVPHVAGWPAWIALGLASLAVSAGVAYTIRYPVLNLYNIAYEAIVIELGLGALPVALWLLAFVVAVTMRRSWLGRARPWLGSLPALALVGGSMAFFEAYDGIPAWFTLQGEVSLGGNVGEAVVGSTAWTGILRLIGIGVLGLAMVAPLSASSWRFGLTVVGGVLIRVLVYAYLVLVVAIKALLQLGRSKAPSVARRRQTGTEVTQQPNMPPEVLTPYTRLRTVNTGVAESGRVTPATLVRSTDPEIEFTLSAERNEFSDAVAQERAEREPAPRLASLAWLTEPDSAVALVEAPAKPAEADEEHADTRTPEVGQADDSHADIIPASERSAGSGASEALGPFGTRFNRFWGSVEDEEEDESEPLPGEAGSQTADPYLDDEPEETPALGGPAMEMTTAPDLEPEPLSQTKEWARPSIDVLTDLAEGGITEEEMEETAETIRKTLEEYGIEIDIGQMKPGPTVTMYGLVPGWVRRYKQVKETDEEGRGKLDETGRPVVKRVESKTRVKVDSILSREKDLALALKTPSIRIETPVMGKSMLGIEVPNPNPSLVTLRSVMESPEFEGLQKKGHLPIAFGRASGGESVVMDLAKMPHLLIAGATGSGKSVCLNAIVSCLIMEKTPAEMRLLLIDPKRVELTPYNGIPHLLTPVVVEVDQVVGLLKGMIREMLDRYRRMEEVGVRNIEAYNERMPDKMTFLVVAVDELADLMMSAAFDVEQSICRLAQLGRATGIHLILATQRPSVDVVTGLIKANFPSRISFGVTSHVDSRTILDSTGADKLLGRGDMLYLPLDASRPMRAQGVFISDQEISSLVGFWENTPRARLPRIDLRPVESDQDGADADEVENDAQDELLYKAIELANSYKKVSTSLLQRRMRIGYPRAARLMDQLEDQGIVGPSDGSKSRDVIISSPGNSH